MGTLGLLVKAKELGIISEVRSYIEKIQSTNFRVSKSLVYIVLQKTGEKLA